MVLLAMIYEYAIQLFSRAFTYVGMDEWKM